ncbi:MAG TPA: Uma2 family endonuclease [Thermoanaerobaculia bacterium]|nr:Uma2 family endonuclease [Thermoanaerobaculia bacterium]
MSEPAHPLTFLDDGEQTWPAQGHWTYEDYLRLPDDGRRYEVIRGVLYVSPSPRCEHQYAALRFAMIVGTFVLEQRLGLLLPAPFDVILSNIATPVQPDFVFIRSGRGPRPRDSQFRGVPNLVVEILSPGNRRYDQELKLDVYQDAGVAEYWLIDPMARTVVIYALGENRRYAELDRGGEGETVRSRVLEGLSLQVGDLFLPERG